MFHVKDLKIKVKLAYNSRGTHSYRTHVSQFYPTNHDEIIFFITAMNFLN